MLTALFVKAQNLRFSFRDRFASERGASAVEYGLLVALIAAVIVVVVSALGKDVSTGFKSVDDCVNGSASGC
ncbi:MAG: Flp family type IVb pilin [Actinomycetota bacterium]|jgi:pilus assembly protein Flp/PilA